MKANEADTTNQEYKSLTHYRKGKVPVIPVNLRERRVRYTPFAKCPRIHIWINQSIGYVNGQSHFRYVVEILENTFENHTF